MQKSNERAAREVQASLEDYDDKSESLNVVESFIGSDDSNSNAVTIEGTTTVQKVNESV